MYLLGCTSYFQLARQFGMVVAALGLSLFVEQANSQTPGSVFGTAQVMEQVQSQIVKADPAIAGQVLNMRADFDKVDVYPTEEQVRYVLSRTDACTDASVRDVLLDPDKRREAAWLFYLDTYSREGPKAAQNVFVKLRDHPRTLRE